MATMDTDAHTPHWAQVTPHSGSGKVFNFIEFINSNLVEGDKQAMIDKVLETFDDNSSAQILFFEWNPSGLKSFLEKVDQLPPSTTTPPHSLQNVLDTAGDARHRMLMSVLLEVVREASGCEVIDGSGGIVGIIGNPAEFYSAVSYLATMNSRNRWISEVLATLPPLEGPLATLHMPTFEADGTTEPVQTNQVLWN
jgi:hypothetical protein